MTPNLFDEFPISKEFRLIDVDILEPLLVPVIVLVKQVLVTHLTFRICGIILMVNNSHFAFIDMMGDSCPASVIFATFFS